MSKKDLTQRELEVLKLLTFGKSNEVIADILSISDTTVKAHISSILKKLEVTDRLNAAIKAIRGKWFE